MIKNIRFHNDKINVIHPSIDYHNGGLYKGVLLPTKVRTRYKDMPYLVTSNRELIAIDSVRQLKNHNISIRNELTKSTNWDLDSIESYLKDGIKVSSKKLLNDVVKALRSYLVLCSEHDYMIIALWIMSTHLFPVFTALPLVYLNGERGSGKTKCLQLCALLAQNPILSSSMSGSSMFRMIEGLRPTLILDELEMIKSKQYTHLINTLLSGYKAGSQNYRVNGMVGNFETSSYSTFCPKILASINHASNDALNDRCIRIEMQRATSSVVNRDIDIDDGALHELRNKLHVWSMNNANRVHKIYTTIQSPHPQLSGRRWEIFKSLFAIHAITCPQNDGILANYAVEMNHVTKVEDSPEHIIVRVLAENIKRGGYFRNRDIFNWFSDATVNSDMEWIRPNHLGYILRGMNVNHKKNMGGRGVAYRITLKDIRNLKHKYEIS
jgi:hypothetical protein